MDLYFFKFGKDSKYGELIVFEFSSKLLNFTYSNRFVLRRFLHQIPMHFHRLIYSSVQVCISEVAEISLITFGGKYRSICDYCCSKCLKRKLFHIKLWKVCYSSRHKVCAYSQIELQLSPSCNKISNRWKCRIEIRYLEILLPEILKYFAKI